MSVLIREYIVGERRVEISAVRALDARPVDSAPDSAQSRRHDLAVLVAVFDVGSGISREVSIAGAVYVYLRLDREYRAFRGADNILYLPVLDHGVDYIRVEYVLRARFFDHIVVYQLERLDRNRAGAEALVALGRLTLSRSNISLPIPSAQKLIPSPKHIYAGISIVTAAPPNAEKPRLRIPTAPRARS